MPRPRRSTGGQSGWQPGRLANACSNRSPAAPTLASHSSVDRAGTLRTLKFRPGARYCGVDPARAQWCAGDLPGLFRVSRNRSLGPILGSVGRPAQRWYIRSCRRLPIAPVDRLQNRPQRLVSVQSRMRTVGLKCHVRRRDQPRETSEAAQATRKASINAKTG